MRFGELFILAAAHLSEPDWYHGKLEGWYYFQEQHSIESESPYAPDEAVMILEEEKLKLQEILSLALLAPTKKNIKTYIAESKRQVDRSVQFAESCDEVLSETTFKKLAKTHFLLFCFLGRDTTSHQRGVETAQMFSEKNGWKFKVLSLDGAEAEGTGSFETDRGISKVLDLRADASFYAVNPVENQALFLGDGSSSITELEQSIELLLGAYSNENE